MKDDYAARITDAEQSHFSDDFQWMFGRAALVTVALVCAFVALFFIAAVGRALSQAAYDDVNLSRDAAAYGLE